MTIDERILKWGQDRGLTKYNKGNEDRLFEEEMEETINGLCDTYVVLTQTVKKLQDVPLDSHKMQILDTIPFMVCSLGYDFEECMDETLKEIESRKGFINSTGKFQKFKQGEEGYERTYVPDYAECKIGEDNE